MTHAPLDSPIMGDHVNDVSMHVVFKVLGAQPRYGCAIGQFQIFEDCETDSSLVSCGERVPDSHEAQHRSSRNVDTIPYCRQGPGSTSRKQDLPSSTSVVTLATLESRQLSPSPPVWQSGDIIRVCIPSQYVVIVII